MRVKAAIFTCLVLLVPNVNWATDYIIDSDNATGLNRSKGVPLYKFELPNGAVVTPGFDALGEYDPDPAATNSIPLDPLTPDNTILASFLDPKAFFAGQPVNPALLNVLLRDVQTWTNFAPAFNLSTRSTPPAHLDAPVFPGVSQAEPNPEEDVTMGEWFEAKGKMRIKCNVKGNSVKIKLRGLLPNRLYTVWALWFVPGPNPAIFPQPLGGVPNVYVTDRNGRATFKRNLNFCPPEAAQAPFDGKILVELATHLHSDHIAYGGIPSPIQGGPNAMPPGTVLHGVLSWNMGNGERFSP